MYDDFIELYGACAANLRADAQRAAVPPAKDTMSPRLVAVQNQMYAETCVVDEEGCEQGTLSSVTDGEERSTAAIDQDQRSIAVTAAVTDQYLNDQLQSLRLLLQRVPVATKLGETSPTPCNVDERSTEKSQVQEDVQVTEQKLIQPHAHTGRRHIIAFQDERCEQRVQNVGKPTHRTSE